MTAADIADLAVVRAQKTPMFMDSSAAMVAAARAKEPPAPPPPPPLPAPVRAVVFAALHAGRLMRETQKDYFRERSQKLLTESRAREAYFDRLLDDAAWAVRHGEPRPVQQTLRGLT